MSFTPEQEKLVKEILKRPTIPRLPDAAELCRLEGSQSVQRLFELDGKLISMWNEQRDSILWWW